MSQNLGGIEECPVNLAEAQNAHKKALSFGYGRGLKL
jgi:hypothetical protein